MSSYEPNTTLNLSLNNHHDLPSPPMPSNPVEPRVFSCNYCRRKFYSSQALGGHQNAHKLERTLAKKSREMMSLAVQRSRSRSGPGAPTSYGMTDFIYGSMSSDENGYKSHNSQEDFTQLDLSLRL